MEPLFTAAGLHAYRLTPEEAPALQALLDRCGDYYALVEGRPAEPDAAAAEFTSFPAGHDPADAFCLGLRAETPELAGTLITLRNFRRPNQWYIGLFMLDPGWRGRGTGRRGTGRRGTGRACTQAFEAWAVAQGANSLLLAAVETNTPARKFWGAAGFKPIHEYHDVALGLRRHTLIEYEKRLPS